MKLRGSHVLAALAGAGVGAGLVIGGWAWANPSDALTRAGRWQLGRVGHKVRRGRYTFFAGGQGPTVVLVHGIGDQAGSWAATASALAHGFRVVVPDLPGHGESGSMPAENTVWTLVDGLEELLDLALAPDEPIIMVGNSLGGWITMEYALRHPERVRQIVLVNSAGLTHDLTRDAVLPLSRTGMTRKVNTLLGKRTPPLLPGPVLDALIRDQRPFLYELFANIRPEHFLDDRLADLHTPATLLFGGDDDWFPPDYAYRLAAALPNAELHLVREWAHMPQLSHSDTFVQKLLEVLLWR